METIRLSDGSELDVRRLKVSLIATMQASGSSITSVSDIRNKPPLFDKLFGEDDRPPTKLEVLASAKDLLKICKRKRQKGSLVAQLEAFVAAQTAALAREKASGLN